MKKSLLTISLLAAVTSSVAIGAVNDILRPTHLDVTVQELKSAGYTIQSIDPVTGNAVIDLMVFYQPSYEKKVGAQVLHDRIAFKVEKLNAALAKNNIKGVVRLVNAQPVTGIPDDLPYQSKEVNGSVVTGAGSVFSDRVLSPYGENGGYPENIVYTSMGADLAVYMRDYNRDLQPGDELGFGSLGGEVSTVFDTFAVGQNNGDLILAHEVGHNLNAGHLTDDGFTYLPAAHAHTCAGVTTIMGPARPDAHVFFSSPAISVSGEPCGVAGTNDNASVIAEYLPIASVRRSAPEVLGEVFFENQSYEWLPGSDSINVVIRRNGNVSEAASVQVAMKNGTAKEGVDYETSWQRVSFDAGSDAAIFQLKVTGTEPKGKASVVLRYPHKLSIADSESDVTFTDVQPLVGKFSLPSNPLTVQENAQKVTVTVTRTEGDETDHTIRLYTEDGQKKAGIDYTAVDQTLKFGKGETTKTVDIQIINNTAVDSDGAFSVKIDGMGADTITAALTVTIKNDDTATPPASGGNDSGGGGGGSLSPWFLLALGAVRFMRNKVKKA
jgi:hypothetical protein